MRFFHCPLSTPPVGVDWGSRWVKIVHLRRTGKTFRVIRVVRFCWQKQQQHSKQLRFAWKFFDLRKKTVFLALDSDLLLFSPTDVSLTHNIFRLQPQGQSAPLPNSPYRINTILQDTAGKQYRLHICANQEQIEMVKQQTIQAGLRLEVIDNKVLALCNAYSAAYADKCDTPTYLLHLGHQCSCIIFYQAGIPVWTQKLELSGDFLVRHLGNHQKTPFETIENLLINGLIKKGQSSNQEDQQIIWDLLTTQTRHIAALIQQKRYDADTIYVSGGLVLVPQLLNLLRETLRQDVRKFDCWRTLQIDETDFDLKYLNSTAPHFAVAFGMALRAASPDNKRELS